jgi:ribosome-associated heat shock protein Hsp15
MTSVRLDKWLWAARFFRTRTLAKQALEKGWVKVNGVKARASREVQIGMELEVRQGQISKTLMVLSLSEQRGPAAVAAQLYQETRESQQQREEQTALRRAQRDGLELPENRPERNQRRRLQQMKRQLSK